MFTENNCGHMKRLKAAFSNFPSSVEATKVGTNVGGFVAKVATKNLLGITSKDSSIIIINRAERINAFKKNKK